MKTAIIKADDIKKPTERWDLFFKMLNKKGVPVSAGIICNSLKEADTQYRKWLLKLQSTSQVEFWNHGWDHSRWNDAHNVQLCEFRGTDYADQKKHIADAQALMTEVLGITPVAFGAPYNAMDESTLQALNDFDDIRLIFSYSEQSELNGKHCALMNLKGEHDGTGKPDYAKFKDQYQVSTDTSCTAIQFHPDMFEETDLSEAEKIIDFMLADGWRFTLPKDIAL